MKKIIPFLVLIPFTAFSVWVAVQHGPLGFLSVAWREPWAMQMLLDLTISVFLVGSWMRRDARERGIAVLPFLALMPVLGSIPALCYLVLRSSKPARSLAGAAAGG
jgi:hypothetical protein